MASIKKIINGMISGKNVFELNMFCLKILSELSEILSKVYIGLHVKYPILFSDFKEISIFSIDLQTKKKLIIKILKILPVEAELFHADGQTDRYD